MTTTAAHLVDRVLPTAPYRRWVLSLPRQVRFLLARDHGLLGEVVGIFLRKVFAWQRRRARSQGIAKPHTGDVTFVQRFGSLLNLKCHAHALLPVGVFATGGDFTCTKERRVRMRREWAVDAQSVKVIRGAPD